MQKEVIQATLADEFGLDVEFRETTPIYIERPVGVGAAVEIARRTPTIRSSATVGLRIEPAPIDTVSRSGSTSIVTLGPAVRLQDRRGVPRLIEATCAQTLEQGLYGWQVMDCERDADGLRLRVAR